MSESQLDHYARMRDKYLSNAEQLAGKREFRKASELLWGAVTQAIKALAAKRGLRIENHRQFFDFMQGVAREIREPELYETFLFLNELHRNFYDETIRDADFSLYFRRALEFLRRLQELKDL